MEAGLDVYGYKKSLLFSSPLKYRSEDLELLKAISPSFEYTEDYISVSLNNMGAMLHPAPTLLNASRIESGEKFFYYTQGITPRIAQMIEKLDNERKEIFAWLRSNFIGINEWLDAEYGASGSNLFEKLRSVKEYQKILAPGNLEHRHVIDDTLTGLVPILKVGEVLKLPMRCTRLVVELASYMLGRDFYSEGRYFSGVERFLK